MTDKDNIQKLLEIAGKLSPEEREALLKTGVVMPAVTQADIDGRHKFGYRCKYCGGVALVFIGETFSDGSGNEVGRPPLSLPIHQIPFAQPELPPSRYNRMSPLCQCCGQHVVLSRGYLVDKHVIEIDRYKERRHAGYEKLKKHRENRDSNLASHNPDGSPISLATNYDKSEDRQLAETRARQEAETPGITNLVEQTAAQFNLLEHIQSGPSGRRGKR